MGVNFVNIIGSKYRCKECKGSEICEHQKRKSLCKICGGSAYCKHNIYKARCKDCGGTNLCKTNLCTIRVNNNKYEGYCLNCFINIFPEKPNARNYKTKENHVIENILTNFPKDKYS